MLRGCCNANTKCCEYIFVLSPCSVLHLRIANILFKWPFELSSYFYVISLVPLLFFTIIYYTLLLLTIIYYTRLALLWCWLQVFFQYCITSTSGLLYLIMVHFTTINITFEWNSCDISLLPFHVLYQYFPRILSFLLLSTLHGDYKYHVLFHSASIGH